MRQKNSKVDELGKIELFRRCRPADLRRLASIADEVKVSPGETLCHEGQTAFECFVIASGEVEVRVHDQPVAVLGPGQVVGEMALLDGGPRTASVIALTDVQAFAIDRRRLDGLLEDAPAIARAMLKQLSGRLRRLDDELVAATAGAD
jgi:CRP/FNR family transcriptional regulator, cyclic AMP receptor protein